MTEPRREDPWVALGIVTRPHGIRGEVRVHPYHKDSPLLTQLQRVFLSDKEPKPTCYEVLRSRRVPKTVLLTLKDVVSRNAAEELRGYEVCAHRDDLPDTEEDAFYLVDLIGLKVVQGRDKDKDKDSDVVGTVIDVMTYPSIECVRVQCADGVRELPLMRPWVEDVDMAGKTIHVNDWSDVPVESVKKKPVKKPKDRV